VEDLFRKFFLTKYPTFNIRPKARSLIIQGSLIDSIHLCDEESQRKTIRLGKNDTGNIEKQVPGFKESA
jgi:hypothetical protein